jgi:hypothetical protein
MPTQPPVPELDSLFDHAWSALGRGAADARHGFHLPVVATVDATGHPDARTVVLRAAIRGSRELLFHTDTRSGKLHQLEAGLCWVFYDRKLRLQVRARGPARLAEPDRADARWRASTRPARKAYLAEPAPGSAVDAYTSGFQGPLEGPVVPTEAQLVSARTHFTAVVGEVVSLEVLRIRREGHQRARFTWRDRSWHGGWLVP